MLIELYGRNFGCFRDEFRLSMLATDIDPGSDRGIAKVKIEGDDEPLRLLRSVALYGPNASGKSTLLRAADALRSLLATTHQLASDSPLQPYEPFALGPQSNEPVTLGAKAVIDGRVYDYVVAFNGEAFTLERLERVLRDGTREKLIDRDRQHVEGAWREDPQFGLVSKEFRSNALLLSLADSLAPGLAKEIAVGLRRLLRYADPSGGPLPRALGMVDVAQRTCDNEAFRGWLLARLRTADVGVVEVRHEGVKLAAVIDLSIREFFRDLSVSTHRAVEGTAARTERRIPDPLTLLHESNSGSTPLPYARESLGTQRLLEWAPLVYDLTHADKPQAAFVDEFDASMHPHLLRALIDDFNCNPGPDLARGQLIFTTHETALLDDEAKDAVLRRDQIYLTEKDATGASRLFSVAEFRERNNLNIRRRYLQGRYGALPSVGSFAEQ